MELKVKLYTDPGHGWVAVKRKLLDELGIADKITYFSFQKGKTVYLEEDCDLSVFLKAKKEAGEEVEMLEVYQENTPIRSYPSYGRGNR